MIGLYTGGVTEHGSHVGRALRGFPFFDAESNRYCAYERPGLIDRTERRQPSEFGRKILRHAINEFDRVIYILSQTLGFHISEPLAGELLVDWLANEGYLYTGAHLRNIPWMMAYFSRRQSLFGRRISGNDALIAAIQEHVPYAVFRNSTLTKGLGFYSVTVEFIGHRVRHLRENEIEETMLMRVFGTAPLGGDAPQILEQEITFDETRFAALCGTSPERARRNDGLLLIAERLGGALAAG